MKKLIRVKLKRAWTVYPSTKATDWIIEGGEYHIRATNDDESDGWERIHYDEVDVEIGAKVITSETNRMNLTNREFYEVTTTGLKFVDCD